MSIFKCNRCPYSTASQWLLKEHEFTDHAQNIKIDPNSSKAPTTVSFGPNVAKAPTSIHVSHSVQRGYGVDDVDMNSDTESEGESERDTEDESDTEDLFNENQDLLEIINDIKSTFNYGLHLRKKFREKIENMEEYDQDEWKEILKSYAKLEASVKDEIEGLDSTDKGEEEDEGNDATKEDFWDFIKEFKHALNEKDLKMIEKYFDKEAEKKMDSKTVEEDEGIENVKTAIEKVDELKDDFHEHGSDCFKHCSEEKIHCLAATVNSLLRSGSTVMNPQKAKFFRELMLPYHETVRKIGNPKVSCHEKRKLLQKAQVGEGVLKSVTGYLE
jgi:hypothetical protein